MSGRRNRTVCVFISLEATNPRALLSTFTDFIDELASQRELESIPVHWCFPACVLESRTQTRLVPMLRGRLASGRDSILPRGYSASPHTLLLGGDIRRDLEWALRNPWESGVCDIFQGIDPVVFPANPDWRRESIREIYTSSKDRLLLELLDEATGEPCYLYRTPQEPPRRLLLYRPPENPRRGNQFRRQILKQLQGSPDPVVIRLSAGGSNPPGHISTQVQELKGLMTAGLVFKNLSELDIPASIEEVGFGNIPTPSGPSSLCRRFVAGYSRTEISASSRERRTKSDGPGQAQSIARERLKTIGPAYGDRAGAISGNGEILISERSLIADMSGAVSLVYPDITAQFEEGKLAGILNRDQAALCGATASSYYTAEDLRHDFTNDGAFSFEGERVHGLRASLTIEGTGITRHGSIVRDFLFVDGEESLIVSTVCAFPLFLDGTCVQTWAPHEIPLFEYRKDKNFFAEARAIDGEKYTIDLTGKTGDYLITGSAFKLQNNEYAVFITYPKSTINVFRQLPVRIERRGKGKTVLISPGGCYFPTPGESYSGYASHTVFAITVRKAGCKRYPVVTNVFAETGEPWCRYLDPGTANSPL